jgi:hypothetical protein
MKKIALLFAYLFFVVISLPAQEVPQAFKYQGIARDGENVVTGNVGLQLTIYRGSPTGPIAYKEWHFTTTNDGGVFSVEVGKGIPYQGDFTQIEWGSYDFFLEAGIDSDGGNDFVVMGTSQILSVPYALFAEKARYVENGGVAQELYLDGTKLGITDGNEIELPDASSTNEIQMLSLSGNILSLSNNGGEVTLPQVQNYFAGTGIGIAGNVISNTGDNDNNPSNEIQELTLNNNILSLSNGGGQVTLNNAVNYDAGVGIDIVDNIISNTGDLSNSNEIQTLSLAGATISLSNGGGSVTLPPEQDGSVTNEIQTISLSNNVLTLSNGGGSVTLNNGVNYNAGVGINITDNVISNTGDLSSSNELQTLSMSGSTLSLSNGGNVTLPDASSVNEIQTLSLTGDQLILSNGGGTVTLPPGVVYAAGDGIYFSSNEINALDVSPTNELQALSLSGATLSLTSGGNVTLPDASSVNEIQTLSISGNNLTLSNGGGTVSLPIGPTYSAGTGIGISGNTIFNTGDLSSTNELQNLSLSGSVLSLTNGGNVTLPDASSTNEIQTLSIAGNNLSLSNGGGTVTLPVGPTYTAGTGISISGNNQINNTGDTNASDDITISTSAGGDLSGVFPNPIVDGLQGKPVSSQNPTSGQVMQWNGSAWTPTTLSTGQPSWQLSGNSGTNPTTHFIGTTDNKPIIFKTNNNRVGELSSSTDNVFWGISSGQANTSGAGNATLGGQALASNTTGNLNTALGAWTLHSNNTGNWNVAVGYSALFTNTSGQGNAGLGIETLRQTTTGSYNTASGFQALQQTTTGNNNTAAGVQALLENTNGFSNTATGAYSLHLNTTGDENSALGYGAMAANTTGNRNTGLGYSANVSTSSLSGATAIGNLATVNASNKIRLGSTSVTSIEGQVAYSYPSDGRFKFNVKEEVKGLEFIKLLRPVNYQFDTREYEEFLTESMPDSINRRHFEGIDFSEPSNIVHTGFIAQEVEEAAKASGYVFDGVHVPIDGNDNYSLAYSQFVVPLVKAVQEQQEMIETQKSAIEKLQKENAAMKIQVVQIEQLKAELQEIKALIEKKNH